MNSIHIHVFDKRSSPTQSGARCIDCERNVSAAEAQQQAGMTPIVPNQQSLRHSTLEATCEWMNRLAKNVGVFNPGPSKIGMPHYDARDILSQPKFGLGTMLLKRRGMVVA